MLDKNGKEVAVGQRAVVMPRKHDIGTGGKVGVVCRVLEKRSPTNKPGARVADRMGDDCEWSAWLGSEELVITD